MNHWIALGREAQGFVGYALQGDELLAEIRGPDHPAVLAKLDRPNAARVTIGDATPQPLPAPVLPPGGTTLPALSQATPADVISAWVRLWVAGHLAAHPNWDGVVCALHGDVTHWLHVSADEVVSSRSSLTQRLFGALAMPARAPDSDAIAESLSHPERLATHMRAAEVGGNPAACLGHLLGAELAAMRPYWLGQQVAVIGQGDMAASYASALQGQGVPVEMATPDDLMPGGLAALGENLFS